MLTSDGAESQGIPTVVFGVWLRYTLADDPSTAPFLEPHEREWLTARNKSHKVRCWVGSGIHYQGPITHHTLIPSVLAHEWEWPHKVGC